MESCIPSKRSQQKQALHMVTEKMAQAHLLLKTVALLWAASTMASQQVAQVAGRPYAPTQPNSMISSGAIPRLPNVNIYIKKQEVKKLLGIEARIDYVTNGNINLYPFRFTIPLGYNQSDLIFTWQNLGPTNVNYSISLVIGNLNAVETPLINITRTGLIPKHEQVFKITLPCSGRITDEVDVQVLINISGYVADDWPLEAESTPASSGGAPLANASSTDQQQLMQSDQAPASASAPALRLVQHQLAIRRKKICTAHPTPVSASRPPLIMGAPVMQRPATDAAGEPELDAEPPVVGSPQPSTPTPMDNEQTSSAVAKTAPSGDQWRGSQPYGPPSSTYLDAVRASEGAHPSVINPGLFGGAGGWPPMQQAYQPPPRLQAPTPAAPDDLPPPLYRTSPILRAGQQQQQQQPALSKQQQQVNQQQQVSNSALMLTLLALSLLASLALALVALLGSSWRSARTPLDKLSSLTVGILRRAAPAPQVNKYKSPMSGSVIGSLRAGGPKSSLSAGLSLSISGKQHLSGNATQTGPLPTPGYCFKSSCGTSTAGYYTTGRQPTQQHHYHYQPAPTGDLLGSEYPPCQQQQQQHQGSAPLPPPPPQYPIYHIPTGINPSQTTRLIWNTGNGSSPDGFLVEGGAYMPLSNAPRSDNGSVYQTIY